MNSKERTKHLRLYNTYGISLEQWNQMFEDQGKVCWICKTLPKSGILCVDHRHVKGYKKMSLEDKAKEVRALLCFQCNTSFGRLERRKEPRKLLERIVLYFKKFKIKGDL